MKATLKRIIRIINDGVFCDPPQYSYMLIFLENEQTNKMELHYLLRGFMCEMHVHFLIFGPKQRYKRKVVPMLN
jgi:hypothetical protein